MKLVVLVARILLGLEFLIFGANGFAHFIPLQAPTGIAGQLMGALAASHILAVVFALQLLGGILVLSGRFVPLGLVVLGPIVVNILLYHLLLEPQGLPIALVTTVLWLLVFAGVRDAFAGIFSQKASA